MSTYNKLVRDRIPEMLNQAGNKFKVETLNQDRFILELRKKLKEEVMEYQEAATDEEALEELADLLEVIHSLASIHQSTFEELEQIRKDKTAERGGFEEKVFLLEVEDNA